MFDKLSIPILRKLLPATIAKDIVGVQPMTQTNPIFQMKDGKVAFKNFVLASKQDECNNYSGTHYAVDVRTFVAEWIETQPIHMWKPADDTEGCQVVCSRYIICEELLTWMTLKWG
jgi:hypothetical protein